MLTNPRNVFTGQSRSSNIVPFHMLGSFLLCSSNFRNIRNPGQRSLKVIESGTMDCVWFPISVLQKQCPYDAPFLRYSTSKMPRPWKLGYGSLEMSLCDRAHMTSYWRSIVTMALSRVVSEIFNVENFVTLKLGSKVTQSHWEWQHSNRKPCVWFPISVP